ncbi:RBBP9/YdeN family alpha/beta hydrolase [Gluconacetobacter takamatsuzukensis]|uniref:Alpha/beta hydrolase n=1 Tax=Gluconacetobacter takamatsuzukensis TaxID=1286190 RepID=A0A7W4PQ13_9PROT|nr:alpha/beta hydrolase [Gluconacetobacter takamatsuzukensis]MBB2205823.1 alpha/beta hydrolase [Gluconacetobacter takamatsuzukensis]
MPATAPARHDRPGRTHALIPSLAPLAPFEIVIVPGLYGSGPGHWQSRWTGLLRRQGITVRRVVQHDWANPTPQAWSQGLHQAMRACRRPAILVAHSLGAVLVARQAGTPALRMVAGALLVAPADVEQHTGPDAARVAAFAPLPVTPLPFPTLLVASRNDEWLSTPRAQTLATQWGATPIDAGRLGHIGNTSGVGLWPNGLSALLHLARNLQIPEDGIHTHKKTESRGPNGFTTPIAERTGTAGPFHS